MVGHYRAAIDAYLQSLKEERDQSFLLTALAQALEDDRNYPKALGVVNYIRSAYPELTRVIHNRPVCWIS